MLKASDDGYRQVAERTVRVVEGLRGSGYPAARPVGHGPIPGGGYFYLQERAPGRPLRSGGVWAELDADDLALLLDLLGRHAGLAPDVELDWSQQVERVALGRSAEWAVVAESPNPAVRGLLEECRERITGLGGSFLDRGDLVMGDFGPHNVLVEDGQITAVIDLDDAERGARVIDAVGLLYMVQPELMGVVRAAALEMADEAALRICCVYWIVRRLYQGISLGDPALEPVAERMLANVDHLM